jgi:DNA-binding response OmpR family regulator
MDGELILIIDDEANIVQLARLYLERDNFRVHSASNGIEGYDAIQKLHPRVVILDIMLPGMDGLELCRKLRRENNPVPIIMLTAKDEDIDKIIGLELGADDYLTKPFNPHELVARVKSILRLLDRASVGENKIFYVGDLTIDPARREVFSDSMTIDLRTQEFELLLTFVKNKGIVLTRDQLLEKAWGYEYVGQTRTVDVHVAHLRRKLVDSNVRIETVTGVGYKMIA